MRCSVWSVVAMAKLLGCKSRTSLSRGLPVMRIFALRMPAPSCHDPLLCILGVFLSCLVSQLKSCPRNSDAKYAALTLELVVVSAENFYLAICCGLQRVFPLPRSASSGGEKLARSITRHRWVARLTDV
jgi:hypothetical protein